MKLKEFSILPPVKGMNWNQNGLNSSTDWAYYIKNLVCRSSGLSHVGAFTQVSGAPAGGATVWFRLFSLDNQLFGLSGNGLHEISGGTNTLLVPGASSDGQVVNLGTGAGNFGLLFNSGAIRLYTYATGLWTVAAITGFTTVHGGVTYRKRVYTWESLTTQLKYLNIGAIAGALTSYDVGNLFTRGGWIIGVSTLSADNGAGSDDNLVVISSEGEVLLFSGNDPAASTWVVVGVYDLGSPAVGYDITFSKVGGDIFITTVRGVVSLKQFITSSNGGEISYVTEVVTPFFESGRNLVYLFYSRVHGGLVTYSGSGSAFNFFFDLSTKGWTLLTDLDASPGSNARISALAEVGDSVFVVFSVGQLVYEWDLPSPGASIIQWEIISSHFRLGDIQNWQNVNVRPMIYAESAFEFSFGLSSDGRTFQNLTFTNESTNWADFYGLIISNPFSSPLAAPGKATRTWKTVAVSPGTSLAYRFAGSAAGSNSGALRFLGFDIRVEQQTAQV